MQIKFNKVKPTAKADEQKAFAAEQQNPSPVQQSAVQNPQKPVSAPQVNPQAYQKPAQHSAASMMDELPKTPNAEETKASTAPPPAVSSAVDSALAAAAAAAPTAPAVPTAPEAVQPSAPVPQAVPAPAIAPVESKPMGVRMEDTLKQFLNKQVRVYMADHESVTGRLDIVEDGWIKVCNARSAGSDYYFDEEIINTVNIVRVHVSRVVAKEEYVDYMNELNNNKLK